MNQKELSLFLRRYEAFKAGSTLSADEVIDQYLKENKLCDTCPANQFYQAYIKATENKYNTREKIETDN